MTINTQLIFPLKVSCSQQFLEWINCQSSLTDKLCSAKGAVQLELIAQQWINIDLWSQSVLDIQDVLVFQREILMKSHDVIYWYARSIIPTRCYDLAPTFFDRLHNESIKNLIFNDQRVHRINLITYPINKHCVEFYWLKKYINRIQGILWVRIAEFSFQRKESFYLIEILLPKLGDITL
ncbi:chorismate--pyruvate lyase family protein [Legionella sp.]|uniref:chorismate--pyruvate lyase family protein n=1 Tax=Legionella sp. TaxID=459 RepID=UPI003CBD6F64